MSAAWLELHTVLCLRVDAREAYRLMHNYRDEELRKRAEQSGAVEDYPGQLAMLTGLVATLNVVAKHGDLAEVRQVLAEYANDDAQAREKSTASSGDATPELVVYRASHDSIAMGLYTTRQAAYEHCEAHEMRDDPASPMVWNVDEDGVAELVRLRIPRSPGAESATGYVVTPLEVASEYDEEADE